MIHCKELDIYSKLGVKERTVMAALTLVNKVKKTDITMTHYDDSKDYNGGIKIDINSKDMMCPGSLFISRRILDPNQQLEIDSAAGINKNMDDETIIAMRVAYMIWRLYIHFHK